MNAGKQAAWVFLALICLACSGWYFATSSDLSMRLDQETIANTTDAFIYHLKLTQYNAQGQATNYLETPLLQHIPHNDTHKLDTPYILVTQANSPSWEIHAQQAVSVHRGEEVTFSEQVIMHQPSGTRNQESTFKTDEITYYPQKKYAYTDKDITFEQPGNIVQSKGMQAFLDEKRVQLLNRARGAYVPKHG